MPDDANFEAPVAPDVSGVTDLPPEMIQQLKVRLTDAAKLHDVLADPIMFNGGTILVLLLTTLATLLPATNFTWVAPLCSALAGLFVAMERALGFGARWRYHREMRFAYESIIDMLDFLPVIPASERPKYIRDIFTALYAVRSRESAIPNAGTNSAPT
ncbi:hypothetical protein ACEN9D_13610 [Pseudomonas sp. CT11-2]|jgi:hypothetical protein|uniref:hypothetical protein n=1 Tax=Pseudomonas TaxID=286 RepID=UPI0003719A67|nr:MULTISPECIES: hypothetical protein [Pseudomonas]PZW61611.1 hypothetical protein F475_02444 [Pseudomonas sp. URMO17WK12:I6]UVM30946.1 hypothetical protein LOY36_17325 [Pseudomonas sp. B21-019]